MIKGISESTTINAIVKPVMLVSIWIINILTRIFMGSH